MSIPPIYQRRQYHYDLPEAAIAQSPLGDRSASKLLVRASNGTITHHSFVDLPNLLPENAVIVLNESKVIPARLHGIKDTGAAVEVFLMEQLSTTENTSTWSCMCRPLKKLSEGTTLNFAGNLKAVINEIPVAKADHVPAVVMEFSIDESGFEAWRERHALMPLPPYIKRSKTDDAEHTLDRSRYQTVYAKNTGSVAAATAGLHFTDDVFRGLEAKGITVLRVCLHVGAGTFLPVKADDIRQHIMHEERYSVSSQTIATLLAAQEQGRPIIAVGTTSLRVLESLWLQSGKNREALQGLADTWLRTKLFIHPEQDANLYKPWLIKALLTNFHQPESSLLMLVSALIGVEDVQRMYQNALQHNYRFFSYGDASLLWL